MAKETTKPIYVQRDARLMVGTANHLRGWLYRALDAHAGSLPEQIKHAIVETVRSDFCDWESKQPIIPCRPGPEKTMKATNTKKQLPMKAMKAMKAKKA